MKSINKYIYDKHISEAIRDNDKSVIDMLNIFAQSTSGYQRELFTDKVNDAQSIDVVPLKNVFTDDEIDEIKKRIHPQAKACYENAWKLCDRFEYEHKHEIKYCEGYMNMHGLPIEHAFNCVDGKYVDITVELALHRPIEDTYVMIGEFNTDEVREILIQNGFYGNIYDTIKLNKYKENIK